MAGYSLGGAQSAFVAKLDEKENQFNFKKVLMINPPVSLFNSVVILDELLEENVPEEWTGSMNFDGYIKKLPSSIPARAAWIFPIRILYIICIKKIRPKKPL